MAKEDVEVPVMPVDDEAWEPAEQSSERCARDAGWSLLMLPRDNDERALHRRWWQMKKSRWVDDGTAEFALDPEVVMDHELRELGHEYWSEGVRSCPALAPSDSGLYPENLDFARSVLGLRDREGNPLVEVVGAYRLRQLGWRVSDDAIGMVVWWWTKVPDGSCVEICGEESCEHEKDKAHVVKRVPQLKLLTGRWGEYKRQPGLPDDSGAGRHYEWADSARQPSGYVWHRGGVGPCAWIDLLGAEDGRPVLVTEGFKKGAVAALRGGRVLILASVSQAGTGRSGRAADLVAGGHGRYALDDEVLGKLAPCSRAVWAFDADILTKESVQRQLAASMVSLMLESGVEPMFVLFPDVPGSKAALDSFLLTSREADAWEALRAHVVDLGSADCVSGWLSCERADQVVAVAWAYFAEMKRRKKDACSDPEVALRAWLEKCCGKDRAAELALPFDAQALARARRDRLQAQLAGTFVHVNVGEGASEVLSRCGDRLVRPVALEEVDQAMTRACFDWWCSELGREPYQVKFADDLQRFRMKNSPEKVTPISWSFESGLTRWVMPDPVEGPFPHTEVILGRLREVDVEGVEVPLSPASRDATLALVGGIFKQEYSRQVAVCRGDGGNGKGTLGRLVASAFGGFDGSYSVAYAVGDGMFMNNNKHWAVPLKGMYFCAVMETKHARLLGDERLRALTGGDPLPIDEKNGRTYNAPNRTRWWINTNHAMEITGMKADLSRVFPLLFADRDGPAVTDSGFERRVLAELPQFMWACLDAYIRLCPSGGDVPLTPGLGRVRDQMVLAGEAEFEAFANRHLVFEPGAALPGVDLTNLLENEAPRGWERTKKSNFKEYVTRRSGSRLTSHRDGAKTFHGWKGARLLTAAERMGLPAFR